MRLAERSVQNSPVGSLSPGPANETPDRPPFAAGCLTYQRCWFKNERRRTPSYTALRRRSKSSSGQVIEDNLIKSASSISTADTSEALPSHCAESTHATAAQNVPLQYIQLTSRQATRPEHAAMSTAQVQVRSVPRSISPTGSQDGYFRNESEQLIQAGTRGSCTANDGYLKRHGTAKVMSPSRPCVSNVLPISTQECRASPKLTEAVFSSDAIVVIMGHASCSEIAAMRLTCSSWCNSISMRVRKLKPRAVPSGPGPLAVFPSVLALDLTAVGPQRMRAMLPLLASHVHQLTKLSIGDKDGRASWICNRDMTKLARMTCLRSLALLHPQSVTAQGVSHLTALTGLEVCLQTGILYPVECLGIADC